MTESLYRVPIAGASIQRKFLTGTWVIGGSPSDLHKLLHAKQQNANTSFHIILSLTRNSSIAESVAKTEHDGKYHRNDEMNELVLPLKAESLSINASCSLLFALTPVVPADGHRNHRSY